ncbi:four helix bundle protein [Geothermobacter hydrogeniphilus]|uniref:four helix bundle protein n=1 Tax=Geothermobacter hydrogeniphilus TaxID=1969733 RepID=UPI001FEC64AC|nr:four helix bundle protein [Geothermobacter hydrogeniphilus]
MILGKRRQVNELCYSPVISPLIQVIDRFSRTKDQMVQAARSGVQNIAEGSQASATSKKTELKLTQVARASLEELKLDYEDFLRQRELPMLEPQHPALMRFKALKPQTLKEVQAWVAAERKRFLDEQGQTRRLNRDTRTVQEWTGPAGSVDVAARPCGSLSSACLAANAALSLLRPATFSIAR